jgi:hypothetical protein
MSLISTLQRAAVATGAAVLAVAAVAATASPAAAADPVNGVKSLGGGALYNGGHALYVVKDLGGGAYWNVTTNSLYVVDTATTVIVDAAVTGAELVATAADDGRGALLLVNGTVLIPAQQALGL